MTQKTDGVSYILSQSDEGMSIRAVLKTRLGVSSRFMRKTRDQNKILLNGAPVRMNEKGRAGDLLSLSAPEETSHFIPEPIPIDVLYEDSDLLAINKQPGHVVHPTKGHPCHTIANGIMHYMLSRGEAYKIRFINRLDMDTSGVLLVGKNAYCQDHFAKQAAGGRVLKQYLALVDGKLDCEEGVIDLPIGQPDAEKVQRAVTEEGYASITRYRVVQRFKKPYTLVELVLETGRTHQIRVHMAHMGHPVVGDSLYGKEGGSPIGRQALHAAQLDFDHPVTGARLSIRAPLPEDMAHLISQLR